MSASDVLFIRAHHCMGRYAILLIQTFSLCRQQVLPGIILDIGYRWFIWGVSCASEMDIATRFSCSCCTLSMAMLWRYRLPKKFLSVWVFRNLAAIHIDRLTMTWFNCVIFQCMNFDLARTCGELLEWDFGIIWTRSKSCRHSLLWESIVAEPVAWCKAKSFLLLLRTATNAASLMSWWGRAMHSNEGFMK